MTSRRSVLTGAGVGPDGPALVRDPPEPPTPTGGTRVVRSTGLSVPAAVILLGIIAAVGAVVDLATGEGLRPFSSGCYCAGAILATALVRRSRRFAPVVATPLAYVLMAVIGGLMEPPGGAGSWLRSMAVSVGTQLATGAPVLYIGTGLALLTALARTWLYRRNAPRSARRRHA